MTRAFARGSCPGLTSPMATGDGLLARFLPASPIPLPSFIGMLEAADACGNGTIEISARGSVQVRGLTPVSAPLFAEAIAALDIAVCESMPVIADPLPDDPEALIDANAIAGRLLEALSEKGFELAPKVSVVVDGGGRIDLDQLYADIRLRAVGTQEEARLQMLLAGDAASAKPAGWVPPDVAVGAALDLLAQIAALGPEARASDLLLALPVAEARIEARQTVRTDAIGLHPLGDGAKALGIALAFGHAQAHTLAELARIADEEGALWARPALRRALLVGPLREQNAAALKGAAKRLGLIVDAGDPRRRIAACPGAPFCAHGLIQARSLAAEIAREMPLPADNEISIHVSGCAKGCAHPAPAQLTIVGTEHGCGIIHNRTARAAPTEFVDASAIILALTGAKEPVHA